MRHMATHSPQKAHQCAHCEKTFNRKDHLKNHLLTHDPNKIAYVCEECGKKYHTMLGYKRHLALHSASSGDLTCGVCALELGSTEVLLVHLKSHAEEKSHHATREKKHQCDHCERCFYTRKDVRRHLVVHTGCKDFLCQFCAQRFGRKDHLTRHTKKTHSQELMQESVQAGEYLSTFHTIAPPPFQLKAAAMPPFQLGVPAQNGLAGGLPPEVHGLVLAPPEQVTQPMPPMPEQLITLHPGVVPSSPPQTLQEHKFSPGSTSFAPLAGLPIKADTKSFCNMSFFEELPLQEPQSPLKLNPCFEMAKESIGKVTLPKELVVDAVNIAIPASLEISSVLGFWQIPPPPPQNGFVSNTIPMGPGEPLTPRITCLAQQQVPLLPPPPPPLPLQPQQQPQLQPQQHPQMQPQQHPQMQPQQQPQMQPQQQPQMQPQMQPQPQLQPQAQPPQLQPMLQPMAQPMQLQPMQLQPMPQPMPQPIPQPPPMLPPPQLQPIPQPPQLQPMPLPQPMPQPLPQPMPQPLPQPQPQEAQIAVGAVNLGQLPLPPIPHVFTTGTNTAILPHFHHAFR
ncbi:zinc finger protein PLAGL1 isoform X2 [Mesocricetus auratus]|nr:zinc finger protein PLAGL1 isoform X2 [Mesocricetus auratus]